MSVQPFGKTGRKPGCRLFLICLCSLMAFALISCHGSSSSSGASSPTDGTVNFTVAVENLESAGEEMLAQAIASGILPEAEISTWITPCIYKIALVNFWLIKDDDTTVNLINPDENNPTYTEDNPLIVDFSSGDVTQELLAGATLEAGTYIGYKIQFLYLEMQFPTYFHVPGICVEDELPDGMGIEDIDGEEGYHNFRLYFNAHGKFWKRDFVVQLDDSSDAWYWLRREVENSDAYNNFFISAVDNDHPSGGAGPDNTIDLFNDPDFWGEAENYDDADSPIIVDSTNSGGGLNVQMNEFTIDGGEYDVTLYVDVANTFNFWEDADAAPVGVTFNAGTLDLGPGYNPGGGTEAYGDYGLHPMLPAFSLKMVD